MLPLNLSDFDHRSQGSGGRRVVSGWGEANLTSGTRLLSSRQMARLPSDALLAFEPEMATPEFDSVSSASRNGRAINGCSWEGREAMLPGAPLHRFFDSAGKAVTPAGLMLWWPRPGSRASSLVGMTGHLYSRSSSMQSTRPSRPISDAFTPPKGATSDMMPTIPTYMRPETGSRASSIFCRLSSRPRALAGCVLNR